MFRFVDIHWAQERIWNLIHSARSGLYVELQRDQMLEMCVEPRLVMMVYDLRYNKRGCPSLMATGVVFRMCLQA